MNAPPSTTKMTSLGLVQRREGYLRRVLEGEPCYPAEPGQPGRGRSKRRQTPPGMPAELTSEVDVCLVP